MKALVVAPQPFFSPRGTPLSVYYRTLVMAKLGVEVDLLTYGQGQDVDIPGVRIVRIPRFRALGDVKVGPSLLKLFLDAFLLERMVRMLVRGRYDFVHVHEEAIFFGALLKPIFGFKLIYDMHSSLPEQLTNFEFTESKVLIGLFEKLERVGLRMADAVITISEDLYRYANEIIEDPEKHVLIENSLFDPVRTVSSNGKQHSRGEQRSKETQLPRGARRSDGAHRSNGNHRSNGAQHTADGASDGAKGLPAGVLPVGVPTGKELVVYAGTLEAYQGIDLLLEAFRRVAAEREDAFLLIAGGTDEQVARYRKMAAELGLAERCRFTGTVPKEQAVALTEAASVVLSPRTTGGNTPLKIYEQLASGTPLVATDVHSHTQVLSDDVAFLVAPEPEALAGGILKALASEKARRRKVRRAQKLYEEKYSRESYTEKMKQILEVIR